MGQQRKLDDAAKKIRELEARLREAALHGWTMQIVAACLLERFCQPNGSCILSLELRQRALDLSWGVRTEVLPDEHHAMAVMLDKPPLEKQAKLAEGRAALEKRTTGGKKR